MRHLVFSWVPSTVVAGHGDIQLLLPFKRTAQSKAASNQDVGHIPCKVRIIDTCPSMSIAWTIWFTPGLNI